MISNKSWYQDQTDTLSSVITICCHNAISYLTMHASHHIKNTQYIKETNTNLQINGYLPHTRNFNDYKPSTNLHMLAKFYGYQQS